jgi:threonylcarbamoyladenosine tRNA methylthiotransferase MtaB
MNMHQGRDRLRVAVHTLGCKLNYAETATLTRAFKEHGFAVVDFDQPADVVMINTCSVTANADREARKLARQALRRSPDAYLIVVGCYAQLRPEEIASIPGVDLVLGSDEKFRVFDFTDDFRKGGYPRVHVGDIAAVEHFGPAYAGDPEGRTRSFLKIQDGCDYQCAFCSIPMARGASRSIDIASILDTAREIIRLGFREIVLSGVNVGDYGRTIGASLYELLCRLIELPGDFRLRISSIEPNLLTDDIIALAASTDRLCPHFHVPLQSGSDAVLKLMRRRYTTEQYRERIEAVHAAMPGAGVGIDVIVGHPGESERDFLDAYEFLVALPFAYLHVFSYSERPETHALRLHGSVAPPERARRSAMLRILSEKKRHAFYESQLGANSCVLFESEEHEGLITGFTGNYVRVGVPYNPHLAGELRDVTLAELRDGLVLARMPENDEAVPGYLALPVARG